jgi:hypothetical protein
MAAKTDDEATIVEAYLMDFAHEMVAGSGGPKKATKAARATPPERQPTIVVDGKDMDPKLSRLVEEGSALAQVGAEDHFIVAWGRANASVKSRGRQLLMSTCLNVALVVVVGFLAWRNEQKETYVFVRDALGNVVQADASGFLHAGDARTEAEIKGFMRR